MGPDTRTAGGEFLARWRLDPYRVTLTYTFVQSSEADPDYGSASRVAIGTPASGWPRGVVRE